MTAKHQLVMTACALILSAGIANAGPCNTSKPPARATASRP